MGGAGQAWFDPVADILGRVKGTLPARREKQMAPATPAVLSQRPTAIRSPTASPSDSNGQLPEEKPIVVERSPGYALPLFFLGDRDPSMSPEREGGVQSMGFFLENLWQ